jgi:hypothetical protein
LIFDGLVMTDGKYDRFYAYDSYLAILSEGTATIH